MPFWFVVAGIVATVAFLTKKEESSSNKMPSPDYSDTKLGWDLVSDPIYNPNYT